MKKSAHGFTLIELMVVVTIIAILSVIGVVAYSNIQAQARDGRRRADIDAIATAMEANRNPATGTYPTSPFTDLTIYANGKRPYDPLNTANDGAAVTYNSNSYEYKYTSNATYSYIVCARLEKGNGNSSSNTAINTATPLDYYCKAAQQ